eukprot:TRINITY_DN1403_c0_g7_i1.p1 TRINITY_DN1403_c0_g7~~TRINITY_DN1403_c0_g7_i1.p1  ORF type:complete len:139 (-),score=44.21 TRINITY_DN1403_c0_g7_i1:94-510(-)
MVVYSLYVISKSGGLIYQQDYDNIPRLAMNERILLGSTFHGLHAITSNLSPVLASSGIELLETDTFKLQCYQTPTGIKFYITAEVNHPDLTSTLLNIYKCYTDYVLKNPFYEIDQPIRCELFDIELEKMLAPPPLSTK